MLILIIQLQLYIVKGVRENMDAADPHELRIIFWNVDPKKFEKFLKSSEKGKIVLLYMYLLCDDIWR